VSILINLLPDTRQAKLKERHRRQLVGGVSVLVWAVCGGIVALMTIYQLGQAAVIAGHTKSIKENTKELEAIPNLLDALTAQQHSASLPSLYAKRVYMTKFFDAYTEANPSEVRLNSLGIDTANTLIVNGVGRSYAAVAKLARTLEASNVKVGPNAASTNPPYFTSVTITSVASSNQGVSFTINAAIDPGVTSASIN
jgi:Tfp pilus assembly protein PilN